MARNKRSVRVQLPSEAHGYRKGDLYIRVGSPNATVTRVKGDSIWIRPIEVQQRTINWAAFWRGFCSVFQAVGAAYQLKAETLAKLFVRGK